MSRSYKRAPVICDAHTKAKRAGRRLFRAKERQALRTGQYERLPLRSRETSDVWDWCDWIQTRWQEWSRPRPEWEWCKK